LVDHPAEEVLIFASQKLGSERRFAGYEKLMLEQDVVGAPLPPVNHESGRIRWPFPKPAGDEPLWRLLFEEGFYRPDNAGGTVSAACSQHRHQPLWRRKFIVIDEGDVTAARVLDRLVPGESDVLSGFDVIGNRNG